MGKCAIWVRWSGADSVGIAGLSFPVIVKIWSLLLWFARTGLPVAFFLDSGVGDPFLVYIYVRSGCH
jgi:hypothetical protein